MRETHRHSGKLTSVSPAPDRSTGGGDGLALAAVRAVGPTERRSEALGVPALGEIVGAKYVLEATLGRGGMGTVFAARHTLSQRRVALKWLDPELHASPTERDRFLREAEAMGRIEHPSVVTVLDVGTNQAGSFLVMELLRGESLRAHIDRMGRLPARRAVDMLLPAIAGVESAHRVRVVHRDLKPENLFVVRGDGLEPPSLRILDFGVAKVDGRSARPGVDGPSAPDQTGHQLGTPRYMSPEQVAGGKTDERTDVWGLGSILYEMISGRAPFDVQGGEGPLFVAIASGEMRALHELTPDVPERVSAVVSRALARRPEARYATAADLGRALASAVGSRFREPRVPSSHRLRAAIVESDANDPARIASLLATRPERAKPVGPRDVPAAPKRTGISRMVWLATAVLLASLATGAAIAAADRDARAPAASTPRREP